jgi:hypothetical protein
LSVYDEKVLGETRVVDVERFAAQVDHCAQSIRLLEPRVRAGMPLKKLQQMAASVMSLVSAPSQSTLSINAASMRFAFGSGAGGKAKKPPAARRLDEAISEWRHVKASCVQRLDSVLRGRPLDEIEFVSEIVLNAVMRKNPTSGTLMLVSCEN